MSLHINLIAHNIRSCHNVGSLFRTCEGLGIETLYLTGYTPFPTTINDLRLPHLQKKISSAIHKTALGAEYIQKWVYEENLALLLKDLSEQGYRITALEQSPSSVPLAQYINHTKIALIIGNEVNGIEKDIMLKCHDIVEIPMHGQKESFNVVQAAAIALYDIMYGKH
ncbi:MAG: TrmH family RNA methyltransferase [Candidatus Saccharimonadales bacterium]